MTDQRHISDASATPTRAERPATDEMDEQPLTRADRPAVDQRQDSDRTATGQQHRLEQTNNGPATDEQSNGRRTEQRWTSDRKETDQQTGKEQTPPHQATSFPKPPLHASPTSRKHHSILSVSHTHNKSRTALHTITFLKPPICASPTLAISAQSACSHLDLVLTQGA